MVLCESETRPGNVLRRVKLRYGRDCEFSQTCYAEESAHYACENCHVTWVVVVHEGMKNLQDLQHERRSFRALGGGGC